MDVNSMWACLQDHDTTNHWKQVAGWRKVCDLAQTHLGRLHEYRRGLAAAWPPETSAASSTYLAELDELIDKVQRTHDAAAANYTALSAATQAIGTTRAALRKIHEVYATKLQQKQAYDAMAADPKAVMGNRVTTPPVADGELEQLNAQARSMMFGLSSELQQAQATLQKPPAAPRSTRQPDDPDVYSDYPSPVIPPILPVPMPSPSPYKSATLNGERSSTTPSLPGMGPILGGATSGVPSAPSLTSPPTIQQIGASGSPAVGGASFTPGIPPTPTSPTATPTIRPNQPGPQAKPINFGTREGTPHTTPAVRSIPSPNGLIGGLPGSNLGPPGGNAGSPKRVNPIGGVIGGGGAGTAPTGSAGSRPGGGRSLAGGVNNFPVGGAPGLSTTAGRLGLRPSEADKESRRWDPDDPWKTDQGVPPVVRPSDRDDPIDPGPAIGFSK
ncbi:hypothetical protein O7616_09090 [Micromonospora sp. WMMD964]|nr:hypothetical protein [Micromonospora sp. WMMD964]WFF04229.1 hypothetical protein O7616_09090 [Micromonospora sp. WMMD964]